MPGASGGKGIQSRRAGKEGLLDLLSLGILQRPLVDEDRRDLAMKEPLREGQLRGIVRVKPPANHDFIESDFGLDPLAFAETNPIKKNFVPLLSDLGTHGEDMEPGKWKLRGQIPARLQKIMKTGGAGAFALVSKPLRAAPTVALRSSSS